MALLRSWADIAREASREGSGLYTSWIKRPVEAGIKSGIRSTAKGAWGAGVVGVGAIKGGLGKSAFNTSWDVVKGIPETTQTIASSGMWGKVSKASALPGKVMLAFPGVSLYAGMYGYASAQAYDPSKHRAGEYAVQETAKFGADILGDTLFLAAASVLPFGGIVGMAGLMGMYALGANPGEILGTLMERAEETTKEKMSMGPKPITKNEQTIRAAQRSLSLLGQGNRNHSMLGSEAEFMHN